MIMKRRFVLTGCVYHSSPREQLPVRTDMPIITVAYSVLLRCVLVGISVHGVGRLQRWHVIELTSVIDLFSLTSALGVWSFFSGLATCILRRV